jgi:membrane protease YdiL (CAAX protease family)
MDMIMDLLRNYGEFIFPIIAIIGMSAIVLFNKEEKDLFKISWDKLAMFLAFLFVLSLFRILRADYLVSHGLAAPPQTGGRFYFPLYTLGLVFWEDFFFAIPIYFIMKKCKRNWLKVISIILISALFGLGHLYQGWEAVVALAFAPYFITYHYGKKYGFGTTMIAHIMYDCATIITFKLLPYLLY